MFSLAQGLHQRHVAATQMNELSSRPDVTLLDIERTSHTNIHSHIYTWVFSMQIFTYASSVSQSKGEGNASTVSWHELILCQDLEQSRKAARSHSVFTLKLEASNTSSGGVTSTKVSRPGGTKCTARFARTL